MFESLRDEATERFLAARLFLALVPTLETQKLKEAMICKGLLFVELYAAYEYAVRSIVQAALLQVRASGLSPREVRREILSLALEPRFSAVASVGRERKWRCRLDLLEGCDSPEPLANLNETVFPSDGSQYRVSQLKTIWSIFGISAPIVPEPRHLGRIDELVENRNAISHGRRTAAEVGRGYSSGELETRIADVEAITLHLISTMERAAERAALRR